ncbi:acetyl-CoA synthetase-like protein, partial [Gloeophyllum trabeum ATCC 11539]
MSTLTFSLPPSDGSLSIPQVYDYHYVHNAGAPLFKYRASNGEVKTLSWATSVRAIHRVARLIQAYVENAGQRGSGSNPVVFAILASIDSFTYFALMAGIIRAGHVAFPISTRNSQLGTAHLLRESGAKYLFLSKDDVHQKLGTEAKNIVLQEGTRDITIVSPPEYAELFEKEDAHFELLSPMSKPKEQQPALILHSSGSTAFPKPITLTHRILLQWGCLPYFGETKLCGKVLSCHSLPMFHAMGAIQLMWTAMNGLIMSAFAPADPPIVPSPDRVFEDAIGTGSNFVFCVPAFVEYWSRDPSRIQKMKELSSIIFAGAPMNQAVGDMLVGQGVPLVPFYGATEIGCVVTFLPKGPAKEGWEYFTASRQAISKHCQPVFLPQETADDIFELALVDCDSHTPCVLNHKIDGKAAYATNDLLIRHPTNPNLWKIYGRADDQIMHSTGEKTNPGPLEAILCTDPLISNAVMFGRGKFHAGVIVEPVPAQRFDPSDLERLAEYRNQIWPTVEKVNAYAPTHSRIFKEMILVTNPSKPFELTPKGTPRRHVVLAAYEQEIEKAYADVAESSQIELPTPKTWDIEESVNFVRAALDNVLKEKVGDEDDIFQHGCDSLQATWIRNTILHALRESKVPTRHIPHNFVYQYPTVRKLGAFLASTAQPGASAATPSADGMKLLADKYSAQFPAHSPSVPVPNAEAVLVTGTTGRLGCHILATLLAQSSVARVFALNRKDARTQRGLEARQKIALEDQGLSPELVHHEKLSLLEGDVVSSQFGLDGAIFKAMQESVTCIIHNAWRVDFNVSLSSMEPMVAGTRNLLDFALSSKFTSPPKFLFVSSLSVYR